MDNMYGGDDVHMEYYAHLATMLAPFREKFRKIISSIKYEDHLILGGGYLNLYDLVSYSIPVEIKSSYINFDEFVITNQT